MPNAILLAAGRVLLASLFILGGINKLLNYSATLASMGEVGLPAPALLLPVTIALELGGGLLVASGVKPYRIAALALAVFTLAANFAFHDFWNMTGDIAALELSLFFKNIAIMGGLIAVACMPDRQGE